MTQDALIENVRVLDPVAHSDRQATVWIASGRVEAIDPAPSEVPGTTEVIDGQGCILGPALVDLYSTLSDPGYESRETLTEFLDAATAGGFGHVAVLPHTEPAIATPAQIYDLHKRVQTLQRTNPHLAKCVPWGSATVDRAGKQFTELGELRPAGAVGFTDAQPATDLVLCRRLLEYAAPLNCAIALWAWNPTLAGGGHLFEGAETLRAGLIKIPVAAEAAAVAGVLELSDAHTAPLHLMRIGSDRAIQLIRQGKTRDATLTASTTWLSLVAHSGHITGETNLVGSDAPAAPYDPNFHCYPPLPLPHQRDGLIQGLKDGTLDAIAIDHHAYTYEEKTVAFGEAPVGTLGYALALPLLWQGLVETGELAALDLWRVLSAGPAGILGMELAAIAPGNPADLILFNPAETWTVTADTLKTRAANTPWLNRTIPGTIVRQWRSPQPQS
ncbi:MAG: dihydroorotase [Cyanobacteria bacterium P01_C01_bin.89]